MGVHSGWHRQCCAVASVVGGSKALIKVMGTAVAGFLVHVNDASGAKAGLFDEAADTRVPSPCATSDRHTLSHRVRLHAVFYTHSLIQVKPFAPCRAKRYLPVSTRHCKKQYEINVFRFIDVSAVDKNLLRKFIKSSI